MLKDLPAFLTHAQGHHLSFFVLFFQAKLKDLRRAASDAGVQGLDLPLAAVSTGGQLGSLCTH